MAKLRVYELAEQMNKTNKEILSILKDKGIEVASHMSTLSDEQIDAVKSEKTSEDTPKKKNIVQVSDRRTHRAAEEAVMVRDAAGQSKRTAPAGKWSGTLTGQWKQTGTSTEW